MVNYNDYIKSIKCDMSSGMVTIEFEYHNPIIVHRGELAELLLKDDKALALHEFRKVKSFRNE